MARASGPPGVLLRRGPGQLARAPAKSGGGGGAVGGGTPLSAYASAVLADNPLVFHRTQETSSAVPAQDASGHGLSAVYEAGTSVVLGSGGPWASDPGCANWSGFSPAGPLDLNAGVEVDLSLPATFELWAYQGNNYDGGTWLSALDSADWAIGPNGNGGSYGNHAGQSLGGPQQGNAWGYYVLVAGDANGDLALWWNGGKRATTPFVPGVGVVSGGRLGTFKGGACQVAIYQHALSDARIAAHAAAASS